MPHYIQLLQGQIEALARAAGEMGSPFVDEELASFLKMSVDLSDLIDASQSAWSRALNTIPRHLLDVPRVKAETERYKRLYTAWLQATQTAHQQVMEAGAEGADVPGSAGFRRHRLWAKAFLTTDIEESLQIEREMRAGSTYSLQEIRDELRSRVLAAG